MFVHMQYNHKHVIFKLESNSVYNGYTLHTHHYSPYYIQLAQYSYNSKHTHINITITKTHYIPDFYQQTYPTYDLMGASDKDMQQGTTLVFEFEYTKP